MAASGGGSDAHRVPWLHRGHGNRHGDRQGPTALTHQTGPQVQAEQQGDVCGSQWGQHQGDSRGHEEGQDIRGIVVSFHLLWSLMSKMSTTFQSVSYGPCSRTGVTCVSSDFGGIIWL